MSTRPGVVVAALLLSGAASAAGWTEIAGGGEALCARGTPYSFFVKAGDPAKVVVDFAGGGACSSAATCDRTRPTFIDSVDGVRRALKNEAMGGFFAKNRTVNPVAGWTHVVVPYCTGDIHIGAADNTYERSDGSQFRIYHRGAANTRAVLNWIGKAYPHPAQVLVTGCSAGAYGSIYWTPQLREMYPRAILKQFADSGAGIRGGLGEGPVTPSWNIAKAAPAWVPGLNPAVVDFASLSVNEIYLREAVFYKTVQFAQFNHAYDSVQTFFYAGAANPANAAAWNSGLVAASQQLTTTLPNFHAYTAPGQGHCVTTDSELYKLQVGGVALTSWLQAYLAGKAVDNISN